MTRKNWVHDEFWPEVAKINSFAIFMGYLLMGVRGLGFLVLTWTTAVLLGGFVTSLEKKDFWCLTVITLVQTAGVFDFLLEEKASDVGDSFNGLLAAVAAVVIGPFKKDKNTHGTPKTEEYKPPSTARPVLASALLLVQVPMLAIVLCPLAILYLFGLDLSTGISLWRLIQHDYGNKDASGNLKPALNVLYSLAVAQGVVYGYRKIYNKAAKNGLVDKVADFYSLETGLVLKYLDKTVAGCMKDPSFARGRNLITYAMHLLTESKPRYDYVSGVMILGRIKSEVWCSKQLGLTKQLLTGSASFSHIVLRLLETFAPTTSPYSTEIRVRAASIVANVAGSIRLNQFSDQGMMLIQCISSLLDTFEEYSWRPEGYDEPRRRQYSEHKEYYERGWLLDDQEISYSYVDKIPAPTAAASKTPEIDTGKPRLQGYIELVAQGLCILWGLAVNEDNCGVIGNTQGLVSKAMAPLISDQLHSSEDHHDEWCSMAGESLELIKRLMATPGPGGTKTRKLSIEILVSNQVIINTLERILECLDCQVRMKRRAVEVLLDLSVDTHTPSVMPGVISNSTMFLWLLLHISVVPYYQFDRMCGSTHLAKKSIYIAGLAGEKLQAMVSSQTAEASALRSVGDVIGSLARTVAGAENNAHIRIHAATILKDLCRFCITKDDECLRQLKKAVTDAMPKVLEQIVSWRGWKEETQANNGGKVLLTEGTDLEQGGVPHDNVNGQESSSTSHHQKGEQHHRIQLQVHKALIDLCSGICVNWLLEDNDLTRQFDEIAAKTCSEQGMPERNFSTLIEEAHDKLWHNVFGHHVCCGLVDGI